MSSTVINPSLLRSEEHPTGSMYSLTIMVTVAVAVFPHSSTTVYVLIIWCAEGHGSPKMVSVTIMVVAEQLSIATGSTNS